MKLSLFAVAAALSMSAAGIIPKCDYRKIVQDYEETIGVAKIMKGAKFDVEPTTDDGKIVASMVREVKIKSGEYKGMVQRQSYRFRACKLYWAFNEKFDPEDEDTYFSATAHFRDNGKLQGVCPEKSGIKKYNPMTGEVKPNFECECYNKNGRPTKSSQYFGCADPEDFGDDDGDHGEDVEVFE